MSCLVRFASEESLGDVNPLILAFGFVIPVTLKELPRLLLNLSARPLIWLSPSNGAFL